MIMETECAGCLRPILDRFLLHFLDKTWHSSCVKCQHCRKLLDEKCFYKEGKIYCRDDFYRCFGPKCGGCGEGINPSDFVRKARDKVYHIRCFMCTHCGKQLSTGEVLYLQPGAEALLCKDDYLKMIQQQNKEMQDSLFSDGDDECDDLPGYEGLIGFRGMSPNPGHGTPPSADSLSNHSLTPTPGIKLETNNNSLGMQLITSCGMLDKVGSGGNSHLDMLDNDSIIDDDSKLEDADSKSLDEGAGGKRRGPRTTIKAKQLEVLKTAFSQTPKPTRHIREQLAKETGLSMRVIQVWFQNKRSKERRMKQMSNGMIGARGFFPGKPGRRGFPMIGDEFGYFPHDKQFHDFGVGYPGPFGQSSVDFFPGGPMGFLGTPHHPGIPMPNMDQPLPMHVGQIGSLVMPSTTPDIFPPTTNATPILDMPTPSRPSPDFNSTSGTISRNVGLHEATGTAVGNSGRFGDSDSQAIEDQQQSVWQ